MKETPLGKYMQLYILLCFTYKWQSIHQSTIAASQIIVTNISTKYCQVYADCVNMIV